MINSPEPIENLPFKVGDRVTLSVLKLFEDKFGFKDKVFTITEIGKWNWLIGDYPYILDTGCSMKQFKASQMTKV